MLEEFSPGASTNWVSSSAPLFVPRKVRSAKASPPVARTFTSPIDPSASSIPMMPFPLLLSLTLLLLLLLTGGVFPFEYVPENDLAKVCRPVQRSMDLLFLLDGSGSVGGSTFQTQMQLLNRLVDVLEIGPEPSQSQLAVMQYATYSFVEFPFSAHRNKSQLRQAIQRIRHKSGTTKTGKALEKAYHLFRDHSSGSRLGNVAKVLVVVSDGRSQDDPVPPAVRLRQAGVSVIALGIGTHVNMAELLQMSGDPELAFDNQILSDSVDRFTDTFRHLATAELCEFSRGGIGADIRCTPEAIEVHTSTRTRFRGRFYAQDHWDDPECGITASEMMEGNGTELVLRIPLTKCGLERQFSANPKGQFFRGAALLQFHPHFRTGADKLFPLLCFYRDRSTEPGASGGSNGDSEIDWQLVREHTQRKERPVWGQMPCTYRITVDHMEQQMAASKTTDCGGRRTELGLGQSLIHSWECDPDQFDVYQSFLVHSCMLTAPATEPSSSIAADSGPHMLIDEHGCSVEPNLMETPQYVQQLKAFARGVAIRGVANERMLRLRCSLRFCDRLMGECDEMLPPKCSARQGMEGNASSRRKRRQTGFPVLIRPLNGAAGPAPPLVMFSKSATKRKRPFPVEQQRGFKTPFDAVVGKVKGEETTQAVIEAPSTTSATTTTISNGGMSIEERVGTTTNGEEMNLESASTTPVPGESERRDRARGEEEDDAAGEVSGKSDPFQEEIEAQSGNNTNSEEASLDPELLAVLSETEIVVQSQESVEVREREQEEVEEGRCRRKRDRTGDVADHY